MKTRILAFAGLWVAVLLLWWPVTSAVVHLGLHDERYVQIMVAPLLAGFLIYWERNRIFERVEWSPGIGFVAFLLCLVPYLTFLRASARATEGALPLAAGLMIGATMAVFMACFGVRAFRAALFPLCCLLLMAPVPSAWMDRLTADLQHASAVTSVAILRLAGVPVFAQGNRMQLPGLEIEVAPECSGIHSFLSLALVALCVGRICLGSGWNRLVLVAATVPFAIFKNAVRISVIASLGAYVNRAFLFGRIHHYGGLVFTPLAILLLFGLLIALQRFEAWFTKSGGEAMRDGSPKLVLWSESRNVN